MGEKSDEMRRMWQEVGRPLWDSRFFRLRREADRLEEDTDWFETDEGRRLIHDAARLVREAADIEEREGKSFEEVTGR